MKKYFGKIRIFFDQNYKLLSTLFFVGGFVFDTLTLNRIDQLYSILILTLHLSILALVIFVINYGDNKDIKNRFLFKIYLWSFFVLQFSFGALLSGYIIFYTRSASF